MRLVTGVLLLVLLQVVLGDVFMHNPRGSNDRNCETDVNRKNANRLFDSQNNAKGGYACPFPENNKMYYYSGSVLPIEWTAQHGCGNGRTKCDIVIQYMCDNNIRDGLPGKKDGNNEEGTDRIPEEPGAVNKQGFGMHENYEYYAAGKDRQRNKGLWTADRNVGDKRGATQTRQNENGDRHGFEIPEERDYYPYWHPNPWRDIAIYTDNSNKCSFFQSESFNVKAKGICVKVGSPKYKEGQFPNNEADCLKLGQKWQLVQPHGLPAPVCKPVPGANRENQLGNVKSGSGAPEPAHHAWVIPDVDRETQCVLRIRYNISSGDFNGHPPGQFLDAKYNGKDKSPLTQDPYVQYAGKTLSLKINTNQVARTFQDRSYVFRIVPKSRAPQVAQGQQIINLNVRGKRGNIVQTFPAVEYDFIPNRLTVKQDDFVHIQFQGSNYNPRRGPNDAEGGPHDGNAGQNARADRTNLVECAPGRDIPYNKTQILQNTMFVGQDRQTADLQTINKLSYLGQSNCLTLQELQDNKKKRERERDPRNCAKINTQSPYFDGGLVQLRKTGSFNYMCSRNNNFSNRDQKATINVGTNKRAAAQDDSEIALPTDLIKVDGDVSIDNPDVDEQEAYINKRANARIPLQTNDNDHIGQGWEKWNATVRQATTEIVKAGAMSAAIADAAANPDGTAAADAPATATNTNTNTNTNDNGSSNGLSNGAVAGIAVGCAFGGIFIGVLVAFVIYKGRN